MGTPARGKGRGKGHNGQGTHCVVAKQKNENPKTLRRSLGLAQRLPDIVRQRVQVPGTHPHRCSNTSA